MGTTSRQVSGKALPPMLPVTSVVIQSVGRTGGNDDQLEEVTLTNTGAQIESLDGWRLRDRSGLEWLLSGSIAPGQSGTFRRNGQRMSLNNNGDEITLLDATLAVQDRFAYTSSSQCVRISRSP